MAIFLLPLKDVLARTGRRRSSHYAAIQKGLFVRPVELGERSRRYPDHEVDALTAAVVAGKSSDEIRELVVSLEAARKETACQASR